MDFLKAVWAEIVVAIAGSALGIAVIAAVRAGRFVQLVDSMRETVAGLEEKVDRNATKVDKSLRRLHTKVDEEKNVTSDIRDRVGHVEGQTDELARNLRLVQDHLMK